MFAAYVGTFRKQEKGGGPDGLETSQVNNTVIRRPIKENHDMRLNTILCVCMVLTTAATTLATENAVVGIKECTIFGSETLKEEVTTLEAGSSVAVGKAKDGVVQVTMKDGKEGWTRQCYLCSSAEHTRRKKDNEVPLRVICIGAEKDGGTFMYGGTMPIRNGSFALEAGQAFWMDQSAKGQEFTVASHPLLGEPKLLFLYKADSTVAKLPIWLAEASGDASTSPTGPESRGTAPTPAAPGGSAKPSGSTTKTSVVADSDAPKATYSLTGYKTKGELGAKLAELDGNHKAAELLRNNAALRAAHARDQLAAADYIRRAIKLDKFAGIFGSSMAQMAWDIKMGSIFTTLVYTDENPLVLQTTRKLSSTDNVFKFRGMLVVLLAFRVATLEERLSPEWTMAYPRREEIELQMKFMQRIVLRNSNNEEFEIPAGSKPSFLSGNLFEL